MNNSTKEAVTFSKTKDANLYLKLTADSGYQSEETRRISAAQWAWIQKILNEKE